ncbi:putative cyanate hydratase protein [Zalerion maritima]|uniref:Cyanate hydratase n=1 Tax=Zalerion maritima TaxID=339359 RepID=A0AAD5WVN5_9PEZI|nr:putative cyanate hydratase protein [Zalerion maritima]
MADQPIVASLEKSLVDHVPVYAQTLFNAKAALGLSFENIAQHLGRSEVSCAAIFYGQATASAEDIDKLSGLLNIPKEVLAPQMMGFPDRGKTVPMPPTEPLIYRLYEVIQNYGYSYKAVMNEKFGDGIMSAICFSTNVEKEFDESGAPWVVITMRGKCMQFRLKKQEVE